ncbi:MAG: hypothetical protein IJ054_07715, partial [Lachnospiraceae bacterium]|nr:hypothetical protein [Lachnospiraceae bacterium]
MTNYTNASPVFSDTMQILETTDTNHADNFNQAFEALMDNSLANRNDIEKNIKMNNRLYKGVDLAVKFASEIVPFSNIWTWIKNRINNHNFEGLRVGDYITWTLNGETIKSKIAGLNTYRRTTDNEVGWHIDFISEDCYSQTVQWNTTNNNNGNAQNSCPYMASNLKTFLESLEANLPTALKNVITNKRALLETRYSSSGALTSSTGWGWQDMGKLWVPTEYEVFGSVCWGTP